MTRAWLIACAACVALCGCPREPEVVIFSDPLTAEEHAKLGAVHERGGNLDRAAAEYAEVLKKDPQNLVALTGLGNVSLRQGKPRLAARYYKRALRTDPDNVVVLNNLAMAWLEAGRPDKALECAAWAAALDGSADPRIIETRARAHRESGDVEAAARDYEEVRARCKEVCGKDCDAGVKGACQEAERALDGLKGNGAAKE